MSVAPLAAIATGAGAGAVAPAADIASSRTFDVIPRSALGAASATAGAGSSAFDSMLAAVQSLNDKLLASDRAVRSLAVGNVENLHQTMMSLEETKLSLQLLLQVRSGALDAYQELMRMQI